MLKRCSKKKKVVPEAALDENANENEELDQAMGGFDSLYQNQRELLSEIREKKVIYDNILGIFTPILTSTVRKIISNKGNLAANELNTSMTHSCILTLFKFATVSQEFCETHIPLIIELIHKDIDPSLAVKSLIGLSDLIKRFPQIVEPYSSQIFSTLESPHRDVKKTAMIIITHLILNDMLKIKGEIVDIIMKLSDEDAEIRKFTQLFLVQLHKKDPMVSFQITSDHQQPFA